MEFINTGLDERILKSLDVEHPSEELVKAMNKQGLVQKEVTVQGKNGTFTRKQWVKASEAKDAGTSQSTMTQEEFNKKYPNGGMQDPVECLKHNGSDATWHGEKLQNPSVMKRAKEEYAQFKKDKAALEAGKSESSKSSAKKNSKSEQSTQSNEAISNDKSKKGEPFERYTLWWVNNGSHYEDFNTLDELKQGLKQKGLPASLANLDINKLDKKQGYVKTDYQNYSVLAYPHSKPAQDKGKKSNLQIPDKLKKNLRHYGDPSVPCKSEYNGYDITVFYSGKIKISKGDTEVLSTYSDLQAAEYLMKNKTESSDELIDKMREVTGTKDLTSIAKKHGLTWEHSDNKVINSARAELKLVNAVKSGKITLEDLKSDKDSVSSDKSSGQKSKSSEVFNCTKFNTEEQLIDAFDEAINSGEDSTSDYDVNKVVVTKVEKYMGNGVKGRGTTPRVRITAEVSGVQNGKPFTKETTLSTLDTTKSSQSAAGRKPPAKGYIMEIRTGDSTYRYVYAEKPTKASAIEAYEKAGEKLKSPVIEVIKRSDKTSIDSKSVKDFCVNITKDGEYGLPKAVNVKLNPEVAKKKTQEVTKGVSDKKSFMEKVKAQGITWKENDHEGINWMRCCMSLNKHFENGGSFDEK